MEQQQQQRRLAVICSHLRPSPPAKAALSPAGALSPSSCSGSHEAEAEKEGSGERGCVFCAIVRGKLPAFKLYEDDTCVCILDSNPLSYGHSLVIPKLHYPSLAVTPPSVVAAMCSKIPFLSNAVMKATECESFNLLVNNGAAAGQVVFHTHFHIIPRKPSDRLWHHGNFLRQPLRRDHEALVLTNCIKEFLSCSNEDSKCLHDIISKEADH